MSGPNRRLGLAAAAAALATLGGLAAAAPGALAQDAAAGRKKAAMCQTCHGIDGVAKTPDAPHLAGENAEYLTRQLANFRSGERKHEQMSVIAESLSDQDIQDLAAWYSSIEFRVTLPPR